MRDSERQNYLIDCNPWWRDATGWEEADGDLKDARSNPLKHYDPRPLEGIAPPNMFILLGPRRAGKSVAIKRTISALIANGVPATAITFCPCETLSAQDIRRLIKIAADLTPAIRETDRYWFFDEITYVGKWAETLKQLRDQTIMRSGCVVATGSSSADLREARGDLGGREGDSGGVRILLPMGFRAFLRELYPDLFRRLPKDSFMPSDLQSEAVGTLLQSAALEVGDLALAWEKYLRIGGFPRAVADVAGGGVDISNGTTESLWNILTGDVLRVGSMSDRDVKRFLARLVSGLGSPLNLSGIAGELDIGTQKTIKDRVDRICASFFGWRAPVSHDGRVPLKKRQDKLYFVDPLIARLPSLRDSQLEAPDVTQLSEQQLGMALFRAIAKRDVNAALDESAVVVRRNPDSGAEIDFVVADGESIPIESKFVSEKWRSQTKALLAHYGRGIIATRDVLDLTDPVWAVPAGLVAWMLDA